MSVRVRGQTCSQSNCSRSRCPFESCAAATAATCSHRKESNKNNNSDDVFVSHCWQLRLKCLEKTEVEAALNLINLFSDNGRNWLRQKKSNNKLCYSAAQTIRNVPGDIFDKYVYICMFVCISLLAGASICVACAVNSYFKWTTVLRQLEIRATQIHT